jgi:hypothetical protein
MKLSGKITQAYQIWGCLPIKTPYQKPNGGQVGFVRQPVSFFHEADFSAAKELVKV